MANGGNDWEDADTASTAKLYLGIRKPSRVHLILAILVLIFLVATIVFVVLYMKERTEDSSASETCDEPACVVSAAHILEKMNTTVKPCDDFYQYACGGFIQKNYIPANTNQLNAFSVLENDIANNLRALLEDEQLRKKYSKDPNSAVSKAFSYYRACMNTTQVENAGLPPILELIQNHGSSSLINTSWTGTNWALERILGRVVGELGIGVFVTIEIATSLFDTSHRSIYIGGGVSGLGETLSDKTLSQEKREQILEAYKQFMITVFKLLGAEEEYLQSNISEMVRLESKFTKLKGDASTIAALKGYKNVFKEMSLADLNSHTDYKFNWTTYINEAVSIAGLSIQEDQTLLVALPDNLKNIVNFITKTSKSLLANEIIWNIVKATVTALPKAFRDANGELSRISTGIETPTPRWRTCGALTNKYFEYATTLLYVDRLFLEESRKRAADLFLEIKSQFIAGLEEQTWMDTATRDQARLKLNKMKESIAYPVFIKDKTKLDKMYKMISVVPDNLFQSNWNIIQAQVVEKIRNLGKSPDDRKFSLPPLTVNAYYTPQENKMTVLVGILNVPFYGSKRLKALNYGSIGAVIGHEITHGFDVSGSQFDENGNVRSWWSKQSFLNYWLRSKCMAEQYNNTYVYGRKLNGLQTLSENIADNGGLKYAYRAYDKWRQTNGKEPLLPGLGFNNDQLFFISYAQTWCTKYTDEAIESALQSDTHSLNPARVRVPLSNFQEFGKTFNCERPKKTCSVW